SEWVKKCIKASPLVLILLVCLFVGTGWMFQVKPTGFIPNEDNGLLTIGLNLPEGSSATRTEAVLKELNDELHEMYPEIEYITSISGMNMMNRSAKPNGGSMFISLYPWGERTESNAEIAGESMGLYANYNKATILAGTPPPIRGLGSAGGFSMLIQDLQSGDIQDFENVSKNFVAEANKRPEIGRAYTLFNTESPTY